jgi:PAS domain S-box-containing protein
MPAPSDKSGRQRPPEEAAADDAALAAALLHELPQARRNGERDGDFVLLATAAEARLRYVNTTACELLGHPRDTLLNLTVPQITPGRGLESWTALGEALATLPRVTTEMVFRRADGVLIPVEITFTNLTHEGVRHLAGVGRAISGRKALETRRRLAQASLDSARDMVLWIRLADKRIAFANRAAEQYLDYPPGDMLGMEATRICSAREAWDWIPGASSDGAAAAAFFETEFLRRDGSLVPVEVNASLTEHDGEHFAVGIIRDITERRAEQRRLNQEMRLSASLAEVAHLLLEPGEDVNLVARMVLERACALTGSALGFVAVIDQPSKVLTLRAVSGFDPPDGVLDDTLLMSLKSEANGSYRSLLGHSLNTFAPAIFNELPQRTDEAPQPAWHPNIQRLLTVPAVGRGRLVGLVALANPPADYTQEDLVAALSLVDLFALGIEQTLSHRELRAARDAAETHSRAKSDFLANMTHEVRTPLNGILGMLQVLQGTPLNEDQHEYVCVALESADRLNRLLGNVIEYARLDGSAPYVAETAFPLHDLLNSLRAVYEPLARESRLGFVVQSDPSLPELIVSDAQSLRHALCQLLDNAIKFTPSGEIVLRAAPAPGQPGRTAFCVEDTGVGIPPEKREHIFSAFVQADASFTRTFGGAGLGLAIVRRLARQLGGSIAIDERPGGGCVMILTVPTAPR